jgi:hypothetical protein
MIGYRRRPALSQIKPARRLEQVLARGLPNRVIVGAHLRHSINPWRGSLLPLGREAAPKPYKCGASDTLHPPVYDCFAAEREQAPSPQVHHFFGVRHCASTGTVVDQGINDPLTVVLTLLHQGHFYPLQP